MKFVKLAAPCLFALALSAPAAFAGITTINVKLADVGGAMDMSKSLGLGIGMGGDMKTAIMSVEIDKKTVRFGRVTFNVTNVSKETVHELIVSPIKDASKDPQVAKLLVRFAEAEKGHESLAARLGDKLVTADMKIEEGETKRRLFLLQVIQPGLVGLMDGSVSTLAPLFAAAFATGNTWQTFLVGLAASVGAGISMGLAEGLSDDGKLTGRGHPTIRGLASGIMTAIGGLGHTLPYLISDFRTATGLSIVIVFIELWVISWIRYKYMDTPFLKAAFQIAVGGFLVFLTGIFIGSA